MKQPCLDYQKFFKQIAYINGYPIKPADAALYETFLKQFGNKTQNGHSFASNYILRDNNNNHYSSLMELLNQLDAPSDFLSVLRSILTDDWEPCIGLNLFSIDKLKNIISSKISELELKEINKSSFNSLCYKFVIIAAVAIRYYLERIRHNFPSINLIEESIARRDYERLLASVSTGKPPKISTLGRDSVEYFSFKHRKTCLLGNLPHSFEDIVNSTYLINYIIKFFKNTSHIAKFIPNLKSDVVPSEFRPKYIKDFVAYLKNKQVDIHRYFNPTGGWGGRLIGSMATQSIDYYMETDPNTSLIEDKINMLKLYGEQSGLKTESEEDLDRSRGVISHKISQSTTNDGLNQKIKKQYKFFGLPIEDLTESDLRPEGSGFDLVFFSPPYFNFEKYPDVGNTQSWARYREYKDWCKNFLFKSIEQSYIALKKGGILAINIARIKAHDIPSDLISYMSKLNYFERFEPATIPYGINKQHDASNLVYIYKKAQLLSPSMSAPTFFREVSSVDSFGVLGERKIGDASYQNEEFDDMESLMHSKRPITK